MHNRPKELQEEIFNKLFETAEIAKFTKDEHNEYESSLKYYRDLKNTLDTAKEDGREEGRLEGKLEGIEEGRIIGIEEGKLEGETNKTIEIARNLLSLNIDIETISKSTGLSKSEIEKIL